MKKNRSLRSAFTLVELLVVISIIAMLAGLTISGVQYAMLAAKKVQARNDMTQIANAVTCYYTEYGKYPSGAATAVTADQVFGTASLDNSKLIDVLRCKNGWDDPNKENTRRIKFIEPKVIDAGSNVATKAAVNKNSGKWFDPWGVQFVVFVDNDYDGSITVSQQLSGFSENPSFGVGTASVGFYYASTKQNTQTIGSGVSTTDVMGKKSVLLSWQ